MESDISSLSKKIISFIQTSCKKEGCRDVLIGVSGGVDSATALFLCVAALGKEHVFPVLLPYGSLHQKHSKDARGLISSLGIPPSHVRTVDITPFVDAVSKYDASLEQGRIGNIMARMRMVVLFDLSKKTGYLVVGTENKSEHLLGYFTRFGDQASDIEPLISLYKTEVFALASFLGVPASIIHKQPTAGLWPGQTDEGEFGFSYTQADEILSLFVEKQCSKEDIIRLGFSKKVVDKVWWWIEKGKLKSRLPYEMT